MEPLQKGEGLLGEIIQNPEFGKEGMAKIEATFDNIQRDHAAHQGRTRASWAASHRRRLWPPAWTISAPRSRICRSFMESIAEGEGAIGSLTKKGATREVAIADFERPRRR